MKGSLTPGTFQAFFQYMNMSSEPITELSYMTNSLQSALASMERVYELLDEPEMEAEPDEADRVIWALSVEEAVEYLQNTEGKILITTGSKELIKYTKLTDYKERCFARVLSTEQAVMESVALGFEGKHLIAMQGPFSKEMNVATIHQTGAKYFVTKESGKAGGFGEKVQAAKETGAVLVAVGRPKETGRTFSEVCKWLEKNL